MHTLRCLKCQSQSIADSDAPMAGDMRHQVRTRIGGRKPRTDPRLADRALWRLCQLRTEVSATTWPLFAIPVLLLLIVGGLRAAAAAGQAARCWRGKRHDRRLDG
jgi:cytochrome c-type biogenesis protein CcmH